MLPFYVSILPKHKKQTKLRKNKIKKNVIWKNGRNLLKNFKNKKLRSISFLHSKPNPILEFCIDTNTNTSTHIKIQTHFIFFFLCFFFLKLNFHSFIQSKKTKTVQSLKKIENRGRYRRKHQPHFIYQNIMPKLKIKTHTPTPTHIQTQLELLFLSQS